MQFIGKKLKVISKSSTFASESSSFNSESIFPHNKPTNQGSRSREWDGIYLPYSQVRVLFFNKKFPNP
jgi:hypothetical protein